MLYAARLKDTQWDNPDCIDEAVRHFDRNAKRIVRCMQITCPEAQNNLFDSFPMHPLCPPFPSVGSKVHLRSG
jgi:hypothetical protein